MTALVLVLLLYNLPRFIRAPGSIPEALLLIALGLIVDAVAHYLLYRRPACAVSAAVTALVLFSLSPGATFAAAGLALAASLIVGKLIWGGTGKNPLNPAMLGLCLLAFIVRLDTPTFEPTLLLLPAIVLSLPFLFVRPFAGAGMIAGMAAALLLRGGLSVTSLISNGVFFWGCLVITDPVTTTARPVPGFIIGALAGFAALTTGGSPAAASLTVLAANILSYLADRLNLGAAEKLDKRFGKRQKIVFDPKGTPFLDLAGDVETQADKAGPAPDRRTILERLEKNGVAGCGGAGVPHRRQAPGRHRVHPARKASRRQRGGMRPWPHPRQMAADAPPVRYRRGYLTVGEMRPIQICDGRGEGFFRSRVPSGHQAA